MNRLKKIGSLSIVAITPFLEIYRSNYYDFFNFEHFIFIKIAINSCIFISLIIYTLDIFLFKDFDFSISLTLLISMFFFYYNNITKSINSYLLFENSGMLTWLVFLFLSIFLFYRFKLIGLNFTKSFVFVQIILLILTLSSNSINSASREVGNDKEISLVDKPDIYFFLVDSLLSVNNLDTIFNQDYLSKFNKFENSKNYYIYNDSLSSYGSTSMSISSILNIDYVLKGSIQGQNELNRVIDISDQDTLVEKIFIENGYNIIKYGISFDCKNTLNIRCMDNFFNQGSVLDTVTVEIFNQTPLLPLINKLGFEKLYEIPYLSKFFSITCSTDYCGDPKLISFIPEILPSPKLHFVHLMNIHVPYVLDEDCNSINPISISPFENPTPYLDAVDCFFKDTTSFIENIDDNSIVIFQSDHGISENLSFQNILSGDMQYVKQLKYQYQLFSFSNISKLCNNVEENFGGQNTFAFLINCLSSFDHFETETKAYYLDEDLNVNNITHLFKDS